MKILSIDASSKSSGVAIFNNKQLIDYKCLTAKGANPLNRIKDIIKQIDIILQEQEIEKIILEEVHPEKDASPKNIHTYKVLMYLQAAINFLINEKYNNIEIKYLYPSEWRKKCGIDISKRKQREALKQEDIKFVKDLYKIDVNDDIADAICIGYAYVNDSFNGDINWE